MKPIIAVQKPIEIQPNSAPNKSVIASSRPSPPCCGSTCSMNRLATMLGTSTSRPNTRRRRRAARVHARRRRCSTRVARLAARLLAPRDLGRRQARARAFRPHERAVEARRQHAAAGDRGNRAEALERAHVAVLIAAGHALGAPAEECLLLRLARAWRAGHELAERAQRLRDVIRFEPVFARRSDLDGALGEIGAFTRGQPQGRCVPACAIASGGPVGD
jgi:hypothetical protein